MKNALLYCLCFLASSITFSQTVDIEPFLSGLSSPVDIQNVGDDRIFIVEQGGIIKIAHIDGTINAQPFLNISSIVSSGGERGLLGLAFHPDFANNGFFYVQYSNTSGDNQISRFSVSGDPDIADPNSELQLLRVVQPFSNHNGGCIAFGPDGYLYISLGDGGSGGDPGNRAQNLNTLLGKLLRIDVDNPSGGNNYGIPADNPFVGTPNALDEIWAYGIRNAWKFSFDNTDNHIWIADVGQGSIEEINRESDTEAGLNYGWRCYEGSQPFNTSGCPPMNELTFPIAEYTHSGGNCSITGGYVYRGSEFPNEVGYYYFADVCSGIIGTVAPDGTLVNHGSFGGSWVSFGEDMNGALYISSLNGSVYKIIGEELGVASNSAATVMLYPNPSSTNTTLKTTTGFVLNNMIVYNIKGEVVDTANNINNASYKLNTSLYASGVYFVKATTNEGATQTMKLIVQ